MNKIWRVSILLVLAIGLVLMSTPAAFATGSGSGSGPGGPPPPPPPLPPHCVINPIQPLTAILTCMASTGGSQSGSPGNSQINLTGNGSVPSNSCSYSSTENALPTPNPTSITVSGKSQVNSEEKIYNETVNTINMGSMTPSGATILASIAATIAAGKYVSGAMGIIKQLAKANSALSQALAVELSSASAAFTPPVTVIPPGPSLCYDRAVAYTISCPNSSGDYYTPIPGGDIVYWGIGVQIPTIQAKLVISHSGNNTTLSVYTYWQDYRAASVCSNPKPVFEAAAALNNTNPTLPSTFLSAIEYSSHPTFSIGHAPSTYDSAPSCLGCSGEKAYINEEIGFWPINKSPLSFTCTWTPANQNPSCPLTSSGKNTIIKEVTTMTYTPTSYTYAIKYNSGQIPPITCQGPASSVGPPSWGSVAPIYVAPNNPNSMNFGCASATTRTSVSSPVMTPSSEYGIGVSSPYPPADGVMASPSKTTVSSVQITVEYTWKAIIDVTTNMASNCGGEVVQNTCNKAGTYTGLISETAITSTPIQVIAQQANVTTP